jgi:hypothetical protein
MLGWRVFTPPAEDLVRAGEIGDGADALEALLGQVGARAVGGEALGAGFDQSSGELDDTFSVTDGEQGAQSTSSVRGRVPRGSRL